MGMNPEMGSCVPGGYTKKMGGEFDGQLPLGMGLRYAGDGGRGSGYATQGYGAGYGHGHNGELQLHELFRLLLM